MENATFFCEISQQYTHKAKLCKLLFYFPSCSRDRLPELLLVHHASYCNHLASFIGTCSYVPTHFWLPMIDITETPSISILLWLPRCYTIPDLLSLFSLLSNPAWLFALTCFYSFSVYSFIHLSSIY